MYSSPSFEACMYPIQLFTRGALCRSTGGSTAIAGFGNYDAPPLVSESVTEAKKLNCRRTVNNRKAPSSMGVVKKKGKAERSDDTERQSTTLEESSSSSRGRGRGKHWLGLMLWIHGPGGVGDEVP